MANFLPIGPGHVCLGNPTIAAGAGMKKLNEVEEVNFDAGIQNAFATTALTAGAPSADNVYTLPPNAQIQARLNDADIDQLVHIMLSGFAKGTSDEITAVDQGTNVFTLGTTDLTAKFPVGSSFRVSGSTGNDGRYTVTAVAYATNTTVTVQEEIPSATADGDAYASADAEVIGLGGKIEKLVLPSLAFVPVFQAAQGIDAAFQIWMPAAFPEGLSNILFNRMQANASSNNQYNVTFRAARRTADQAGTAIPSGFQYAWIGKPAKVSASLSWTLPSLV